MQFDITIPPAGESIETCQIAKWHKEDSSQIKRGEIILTLETDKVSQDIEAIFTGVLRHQFAEGHTARIGEGVGHIEHDGSEVNEVIRDFETQIMQGYDTSLPKETLNYFKIFLMLIGVIYICMTILNLF